jgi:hypothetical protein
LGVEIGNAQVGIGEAERGADPFHCQTVRVDAVNARARIGHRHAAVAQLQRQRDVRRPVDLNLIPDQLRRRQARGDRAVGASVAGAGQLCAHVEAAVDGCGSGAESLVQRRSADLGAGELTSPRRRRVDGHGAAVRPAAAEGVATQ